MRNYTFQDTRTGKLYAAHANTENQARDRITKHFGVEDRNLGLVKTPDHSIPNQI